MNSADHRSGQSPLTSMQMAAAESPINETLLSFADVRGAVIKLKGGVAAVFCNTSAEILNP